MPRMTPLEQFTAAYIECMLWSTDDESDESGGVPLDQNYDARDIAPEALERIQADCAAFFTAHEDAIGEGCCNSHITCSVYAYAGHDFWLTRNGHGCGFWDGGWMEPYATALTEAAKECGELWPCVGDDGLIYL